MAERVMEKFNKPHKCSGCGKTGHRIESCPLRAKTKVKKTVSRLDKKTLYVTSSVPPRVLIRNLKQIGYPEICWMSEAKAKHMLRDFWLMPNVPMSQRMCFRCGGAMKKGRKETVMFVVIWVTVVTPRHMIPGTCSCHGPPPSPTCVTQAVTTPEATVASRAEARQPHANRNGLVRHTCDGLTSHTPLPGITPRAV